MNYFVLGDQVVMSRCFRGSEPTSTRPTSRKPGWRRSASTSTTRT
ncbi:hypothetical protein [Streptomyces cyaneochromogenes]|nr:hypothetical protein [Streptomyces cyaneochromogenes]